MARRVSYVLDPTLSSNTLPSNVGRSSLVHGLVEACGLHDRMTVLEAPEAKDAELRRFHDEQYLDAVFGRQPEAVTGSEGSSDDGEGAPMSYGLRQEAASPRKRRKTAQGEDDDFGLEGDCPQFDELEQHVRRVAGGSVLAAREVAEGRADVAIHWDGGRHHAKRSEAAGFCYVADAVLCILALKPTAKRRVLYLDFDLHHGDGVESAFKASASVLTLSVHLHAAGFYPTSGALSSSGPRAPSKAAHHALNVATAPGLSPANFKRLFESCVQPVRAAYQPAFVVVQMGCDALAGDPCKEGNLSSEALGYALEQVLAWELPTVVLGGGGYQNTNAARCWAYLTSVAAGPPLALEETVPLDFASYDLFGPSFILDVPASHRADLNTETGLDHIEETFKSYADALEEVYRRPTVEGPTSTLRAGRGTPMPALAARSEDHDPTTLH